MNHNDRVAPLVERLKNYREEAQLAELFPWPIAGLEILPALVGNSTWIDEIRDSEMNKISRKTFVQKKEYSEYCNLLQSIACGLYGEQDNEGLIKVEMILFSLADREIASEVLEFYRANLVLTN